MSYIDDNDDNEKEERTSIFKVVGYVALGVLSVGALLGVALSLTDDDVGEEAKASSSPVSSGRRKQQQQQQQRQATAKSTVKAKTAPAAAAVAPAVAPAVRRLGAEVAQHLVVPCERIAKVTSCGEPIAEGRDVKVPALVSSEGGGSETKRRTRKRAREGSQ